MQLKVSLAVAVVAIVAVLALQAEAKSNCAICEGLLTSLSKRYGTTSNCDEIEKDASTFCADVPPSIVGPMLCNALIKKECPRLVQWLHKNDTAEHECERIGLCSGPDSKCNSFGKLSDNGACTATLANSTGEWRLEWNVFHFWKNKGCNPPQHFGIHPVYCSEEHLGCCLSGWTKH